MTMIQSKILKHRRSCAGYTLVEAVVAAGVIGIVVMAAASMIGSMSADKRKLQQRSLLQRSARAFVHQIAMSEKNIPASAQPARWGQSGYDPYADPQLAQEICYSADGIPVVSPKDPSCFFKIQYFHLVITDQKYPSSQDIASLPITRLYFKVSFRESDRDLVYYFSRLQTNFLQQ